jgi:hypothetical protein
VRPALLLLLLGALVAGCSEEKQAEGKAEEKAVTTSPAKAPPAAAQRRSPDLRDQGRDIAWLGRLHRWEVNLAQDAVKLGTVGRIVDRGGRDKAALRRPLVQLTRCEKNLLRQVGEPVAARYRPGYDLLAEACRTLKGLSLELIHALDADESPPSADIERDGARSRKLFTRGTARLEASLRANRPLPMARGSREESKVEPRLSRVVSKFVLRKPAGIEVRCWSKDEWLFVTKEWGTYIGTGDIQGFVHNARLRTSIAPRVCKQLAGLIYHDERPTSGEPMLRKAEAVAILSHEAEHIRNRLRADEATTECQGMQRMRRLARMIGTSQEYADLLAERYWEDLYEYNLKEYKTPDCRNEGSLDLRPGNDVWP